MLASSNWTLPISCVVMSSNGETHTVLRGVTHGAVDFLIKPVRLEELRNMWQHVVRKKRDLVGGSRARGWPGGRTPRTHPPHARAVLRPGGGAASSDPSPGGLMRIAAVVRPCMQVKEESEDHSAEKDDAGGGGDVSKKRKEPNGTEGQDDDGNASKKPRVVWSVDMHQQFVNAVNQLGVDSEWLARAR